ncbi:hypothetical protein KM043_017400 [Ampulex compressa]|nr:hypothetical protein KM043_017400 [Ampulex compressa]
MSNKKTPKIEPLVVNAIRRLQDVQGSTPREISNYISQEYDVPVSEIRPQVQLALKRGITYGILQRLKGGHYTYHREPLGREGNGEIVEIPCHGRKRFGRSTKHGRRAYGRSRRRSGRGRRGRSRGRSGKRSRRGRSRRGRGKRRRRGRGRRRRSGRRHEDREVLEMEAVGKQAKTNGSLSRKDSPSAAGSSISGSSDERHLEGPLPESRSVTAPGID